MEMPTLDYQQFVRMWFDFVGKMAGAAATIPSDSVPADAAKTMRDGYFQALGQYTEEFMRSPQFLQFMKESADAAITLRRQTNDLLAQAHHAVGGIARPDIDSLLMAVRRSESRVLDRLDELAARLDRLEAAGNGHKARNGKPVHKSS